MDYIDSIRSRETATRFFELFRNVYPELSFKSMDEWEPLKRRFALDEAIDEWVANRGPGSQTQFGRMIFYGDNPAPFYVFANWQGVGTHGRWIDSISAMFDESYWMKNKIIKPTDRLIKLLKGLSILGNSLYGRGYHKSEFEAKAFNERTLKGGRVSRESISLTSREGIIDLFWANYLGRPYVDFFGEATIARVKCTLNERVGNGFLLVFAHDPLNWNDEQTLSQQKSAKAELDHGAFVEKSTNFSPSLKFGTESHSHERIADRASGI